MTFRFKSHDTARVRCRLQTRGGQESRIKSLNAQFTDGSMPYRHLRHEIRTLETSTYCHVSIKSMNRTGNTERAPLSLFFALRDPEVQNQPTNARRQNPNLSIQPLARNDGHSQFFRFTSNANFSYEESYASQEVSNLCEKKSSPRRIAITVNIFLDSNATSNAKRPVYLDPENAYSLPNAHVGL